MKNKKGFTLIELIVVIGILAILAVILVPSIGNYVNKANMAIAQTNGAATLKACKIITANVMVGDENALNSETLLKHSNIPVIEGKEAVNNSIVVDIVSDVIKAIWSMKGGQLAMWTEDRGWVYGKDNIEFTEDEFSELSFGLANENTAYIVKDGRNFSRSSLSLPATYKGLPVVGISNNAFNNTVTLESITMPSSITFIGASTFHGCTGLTTVIIPASVKDVGNNAFNHCNNLSTVRVYRSVNNGITKGGTNMFIDCSPALKIYVPSDSVNEYRAAEGWKKDASKIIAG